MAFEKSKKVVCGLAMLLGFTHVSAADLQWVFSLAIESGGDKLAEVTFNDGTKESIRGGGFGNLAGGFIMNWDESTETQVTIGWKFDSVEATNGSLEWDRYPLEALQFYKHDAWRMGGGITYHMNPKISGSGFVSGSISLDNALGFVVEADYTLQNNAYFGVRGTFIDYEIANESINGNSLGVIVGGRF